MRSGVLSSLDNIADINVRSCRISHRALSSDTLLFDEQRSWPHLRDISIVWRSMINTRAYPMLHILKIISYYIFIRAITTIATNRHYDRFAIKSLVNYNRYLLKRNEHQQISLASPHKHFEFWLKSVLVANFTLTSISRVHAHLNSILYISLLTNTLSLIVAVSESEIKMHNFNYSWK